MGLGNFSFNLAGLVGFEINVFMINYIGSVGVLTSLAFFFLCFIVIELEWTPEKMKQWWIGSKNKEVENKITNDETLIDPVSLDEDSKDETLGWFTENGYIVLKHGYTWR